MFEGTICENLIYSTHYVTDEELLAEGGFYAELYNS